jgi:transposase
MVNATQLDPRQERGAALAKAKGRQIKHVAGSKYLVPSATGTAGYVVDAVAGECTCPDHEERRVRCKHVWAVSYFRQEVSLPDGSHIVTEAVRVSYPQKWAAYNAAQCEEGDRVRILLRDLCNGIAEPARSRGRPRLPLADVVYSAAIKTYVGMSGRRATSDVRECEERGLVEKAPSYNSIFRYLERPDLQPLLTRLVGASAQPLAAVEENFAIDSTGFSTQTYLRWFDHRYGEPRPMSVQRWVKCHASVGTHTNVIAAASVTEGHVNDSTMFVPLVTATAANGFDVSEVSADKAYLSHANLAAVEALGARPFVPFKSNSGPGGSPAWERLWHHFSANREDFLTRYHRRSNVEATFSAVKRKFGGAVRSKLPAAQFNEVLLKCLCHNLTCLVHAIHELGIEPKFWLPKETGL